MYLEEVYLFTGSEQVIKKSKIDRILETLNKDETDIYKYDLDYTPIQEVITDCMTIPFLKQTKVIIAKNPYFLSSVKTSVKHDVKSLIKYLKNPCDTTILMIDAVGINIDKNSEVYKTLQKVAYIIDVKELDIIECKAWVKRSLMVEGCSIQDEALNLLIDFLKGDLLRMEQEIKKLSQYCYQSRVTESDIYALVNRNNEDDLYVLIKAMIAKEKDKVLKLYQRIKEQITDSQAIIGLINKTFTELYAIKKLMLYGYSQNDIANYFGIKSGRAYYLMNDAKQFKVEVLENYLQKIVDLDFEIRTGKIDKNMGFEMFLLSM